MCIRDSCSIEDIKKWVDENVSYYDPEDVDHIYTLSQAVNDMLHNFKTHFLKMDNYEETFDKEKELIKYFKKEWMEYYK